MTNEGFRLGCLRLEEELVGVCRGALGRLAKMACAGAVAQHLAPLRAGSEGDGPIVRLMGRIFGLGRSAATSL